MTLKTLLWKAKRHCSGTDALKSESGTGLALYQTPGSPTNLSSFSEENPNNRHTSGSVHGASLSLWLSLPVFSDMFGYVQFKFSSSCSFIPLFLKRWMRKTLDLNRLKVVWVWKIIKWRVRHGLFAFYLVLKKTFFFFPKERSSIN